MQDVIPLKEALKQMNEEGRVFSIKYHPFNTRTGKSGPVKYHPRATTCGQRFSLRKTGKIGINPCTQEHPRSVYIWLIDEFNGKKVAL